jgi:hypothetical protein
VLSGEVWMVPSLSRSWPSLLELSRQGRTRAWPIAAILIFRDCFVAEATLADSLASLARSTTAEPSARRCVGFWFLEPETDLPNRFRQGLHIVGSQYGKLPLLLITLAVKQLYQRRFILLCNRPSSPAAPRNHRSCRAASTARRRLYVAHLILGGLDGNGPSSVAPLAPIRRRMLRALR